MKSSATSHTDGRRISTECPATEPGVLLLVACTQLVSGDELTLKAAVDRLGVRIHVVTSNADNWHLVYTPETTQVAPLPREMPFEYRRLLFLTYISPVHYNSLIPDRTRASPSRSSRRYTNRTMDSSALPSAKELPDAGVSPGLSDDLSASER